MSGWSPSFLMTVRQHRVYIRSSDFSTFPRNITVPRDRHTDVATWRHSEANYRFWPVITHCRHANSCTVSGYNRVKSPHYDLLENRLKHSTRRGSNMTIIQQLSMHQSVSTYGDFKSELLLKIIYIVIQAVKSSKFHSPLLEISISCFHEAEWSIKLRFIYETHTSHNNNSFYLQSILFHRHFVMGFFFFLKR